MAKKEANTWPEINKMEDEFNDLESTVSHLRDLLRRLNRNRVARGQFCPECSFAPIKIHIGIDAGGYIDFHADDCKLAAELRGESGTVENG